MKISIPVIDYDFGQQKNFVIGNSNTFPEDITDHTGLWFFHRANRDFYGWDGTQWRSFTKTIPEGTPDSSSAVGIRGEMNWDANYLYICVADNTWKRTELKSF